VAPSVSTVVPLSELPVVVPSLSELSELLVVELPLSPSLSVD
jgi:hypothetical protein